MEGTENQNPAGRPRRKLRRRWLVAVAALLLLGFFLFLWRPDDSGMVYYNGVSLSKWMGIRRSREEIGVALIKTGPPAIPVLVKLLASQDSTVSRAWHAVWPKLPANMRTRLINYQPMWPNEMRENAINGLGEFGPEAASALPALIRLASHEKDPMLRANLITAVMEIGQDSPIVREFLLATLRSTNRMDRAQVTANIYTCHFKLPGSVPSLLQAFGDSSQKPINEELALSVMGAEGADAVPMIAKHLDEPNMPSNPLLALTGIGTNLGPAVPGLIRIVQTGSPLYRVDAAEALMHAGPDATAALPALALAQRDEDPVVRCMAAMASARIQNDPALAVPVLTQVLERTNSTTGGTFWVMTRQLKGPQQLINIVFHGRETAAWLLGDAGPAARPALPALIITMQRSHNWLRPIAARAIFKITGDADAVMPALLETLKSKDDIGCFLAMVVLREMGPKARPAIPLLEELKKRNMNIRSAAFETLKEIDAGKAN